jgi:TonB family protein
MREPVNSEIKRRATKFPVALPRGTEARVDLFFPRTPRSGQTRVVYTDLHGEHRLDIDTRDALVELDQTPFTTLVSRFDPEFPDEARRAGITHGYAKADLTLDRQGRVRSVDVFESIPRHYFDEEARRTLQRWTYREGRDGRVVRVTLEFKR